MAEKFLEGGWAAILLTGLVVGICLPVRAQHADTRARIAAADPAFAGRDISAEFPTAPFFTSHLVLGATSYFRSST